MKNSDISGTINHSGIVKKVDEKSVIVSITSVSACSGCHAEDSCTLSGKEEKIIEVRGKYNVKTGDSVTIIMQQSMGYAAVFLGYIIPLITVIAVLITMISLEVPELIAGLSSIAILIPYYTILFFFRKRLNEKFTFKLIE
jgi:sigma-E factor negative regulatory protein RseC